MMGNMDNQYNFINQNQKNLVEKIIQFYQETGRKYMNYNEINQISNLLDNLDTNSPKLKEGNDIADPLPYIKEKKKLIKFINHDFKIFNVKVPISIDKMILYQIADLYKSFDYSSFLLVYMNCILNKDESSIESISDGDFVIIIENLYYSDETYLNLLTNPNNKGQKINVKIYLNDKIKRNLVIPNDTKLSQLFKALILYFGCQYHFPFIEMKSDLNTNISDGTKIDCLEKAAIKGLEMKIFGKRINLKIKLENPGEKSKYFNCEVGILSSIKQFSEYLGITQDLTVKGFYFDKKSIYINEDQSFASLGIINDSEITLIFNKNI